jgi:hypothetical protein
MARAVNSPLILTGGPGAGKSAVAAAVAPLRDRCAVIEVDDVRQMLRRPHAAPWEGAEGLRRPHIVRLVVHVDTALLRAERRHYHLTAAQFQALHAAQADFRSFDSELDTNALTVGDLSQHVSRLLDGRHQD